MLDDIKSALKNTIIYGIGNLSTKLIGFILLPLYTEYLTVHDYGILGVLEVSSQVVITIFSFGLYQAFFRWYWDKRYINRQRSVFFTCLVFSIITCVFVTLALYYPCRTFSTVLFDNPDFENVLRLMVLSAGLEIIIIIPNTLIRLQEKPFLFTISNIVRLLTSLTLTIYFVKFQQQQIMGIYKAQIIGQLVLLLLLSVYIGKNIKIRLENSILRDMLRFSFPLMISNIAALFLSISDRYILSFTADFSDVGLYSLGSKMANTITVFIVGSVSLALSPKLFKMMDEPDNKRFYSKVMTYYAYGLLFFVLGMSLFGKEVIKVLAYNINYWDAYKVIPILSFSIFFAALKDIALIGLLIEKKTKTIALIIPAITLLNIALNIIFTRYLQYLGSAYAALISQIIYVVVVFIFAQRTYYVPYEHRKLLLMVSIAAILYALASLSNDFSIAIRLLAKMMAIVSFPFILYLFKFYEPVEIKTIKKVWNALKRPKEWKNLIKIITGPS